MGLENLKSVFTEGIGVMTNTDLTTMNSTLNGTTPINNTPWNT